MPCVALGLPVASGRPFRGRPGDHRPPHQAALDEQIDATVANEPALLEKSPAQAFRSRMSPSPMPDGSSAEYDKIWLPKAPVLAELRKVGATL